ncbi:hypothetical protein L873DRAFT_1691497 [Choiromyces venosus 120613-1]|uniref:Cupredoxin n=1 Tax=Choiromyces venosus 120613-1 TaxID=1336337 RepID=A0A3N4JG71_9PEZI|nr:hypothetical protein L873DRAFT_1691497 [Choiromyces venosus 120613-1]
MLFKAALLASTLALLANAQSSTVTSYPATPTGSVKQHVVQVGDAAGALKFYPEVVTAVPGDLVQFQFYPRNHSVAQSSFDKPCQPLAPTNGSAGFWSGFMPVSASSTRMPVFSILINDTQPIWFYCAAARHCQGGMTGVINPPTTGDRTPAAYKAAAASVALTGVPTDVAGTGGSNNSSSGTGSGTGSGSGGTGTGTGSGSSSGSSSGTGLGGTIPGNSTNGGAVPSVTPAAGAASETRVWKGWAVVVGGIVGLLVV